MKTLLAALTLLLSLACSAPRETEQAPEPAAEPARPVVRYYVIADT